MMTADGLFADKRSKLSLSLAGEEGGYRSYVSAKRIGMCLS
jgi:hypothetical protein